MQREITYTLTLKINNIEQKNTNFDSHTQMRVRFKFESKTASFKVRSKAFIKK